MNTDPAGRFDDLTRALHPGPTRRGLLRAAAAAVVAGLTACARPTPDAVVVHRDDPPAPPSPVDPQILATWCTRDPVTSASFDAAIVAAAGGHDEVWLSPCGCVALHRTRDGLDVAEQRLLIDGAAVAVWIRTATGIELAWDYDADGFAERRVTLTGADDAAVRQDVRYDPATRQPVSRTTWQPAGAQDDSVMEEVVEPGGAWTVTGQYTASVDAGYAATATPGRAAVRAATACTIDQERILRKALRDAYRTGMNCLDHYRASELGLDLAFNLTVRDVRFDCGLTDADLVAAVDPRSIRNLGRPVDIEVNWPSFSAKTEYEQASVMFHELIHLSTGLHDLGLLEGNLPSDGKERDREIARRRQFDRTYACQHLCFGPVRTSQCGCATCLKSTTCDQRCAPLPECDPAMGFRCPCKKGANAGRFFPTCSKCLATCPSGLLCAATSTCTPINYVGCGDGRCP